MNDSIKNRHNKDFNTNRDLSMKSTMPYNARICKFNEKRRLQRERTSVGGTGELESHARVLARHEDVRLHDRLRAVDEEDARVVLVEHYKWEKSTTSGRRDKHLCSGVPVVTSTCTCVRVVWFDSIRSKRKQSTHT